MGLQLQSSLDESTGCSVVSDPENGVESEPRKLPSSKYKGVVPQPNGRWGAQIYEKHQRVWLGTFNDEDAAARAYDVAVRRFRGRDAVRNLTNNEPSEDELVFMSSHSKSEIVDMLRKHTYDEELQQMSKRRSSFRLDVISTETEASNVDVTEAASRSGAEPLFEKAVTPSDVGKLNRLVIPKNQAEKHFPLPLSNVSSTKGVLLNFEDVTGKVWRFRYSYWNSSQSYVLTKGWSRFVKEKNLKAGDTVRFSRSGGPEKQMYIDWKPRSSTGSDPNPLQVVRLFGVNLLANDVNDVVARSCGAKRITEVELVAFECRKKQRLVDAL